ncbi:MAG TPA: LuxR C-terminal-related transcriptional regulator [Pseudomonas sp.]|nr:LuxR C-terminal-related transcriptional regulator [Pseudomonas sp.]
MSSLNFRAPPLGNPAPALTGLPSMTLGRVRLVDALLADQPRLRLLCAPAGFGKTQLLRACVNQLPPSYRSLWISLAGQSLSLQQFCERVAQALEIDVVQPCDGPELLRLLSASEAPLWLVLDDYPQRACPELEAWIDSLLKQPAAKVELVVSCRQRPAWNLTRLLLEDQLVELDARQLAFTYDELTSLVESLAPQMQADARDHLWHQTFGWCAGIRLTLRGQSRTDTRASFWLDEYLEHELLSRLDAQQRTMLYGLAHLPKFSAELCARLWQSDNSAAVFQSLLRSQLFFLPFAGDGQWYRLLPAVAEALQGRLCDVDLTCLRLAACRILNECGHVEDAIELALCAGRPEVAARYIDHLKLDWLVTEQHLKKLLAWYDQMPAPLLQSSPQLIFQSARALLYSWRLDEAQTCIARLGSFLPQPDPHKNIRLLAHWQALQGHLQAMRGDADAAREHCQAALDVFTSKDWRTVIFCLSTLARVAMATGQCRHAQQLFGDAVEKARRHGCVASEVLINTYRIRQMILNSELLAAEALLQESFELACGDAAFHFLLLGRLQFLHGELLLLRGALDASQQAFELGIDHAQKCADPFVLHGYLGLCETFACRGEFDQATLYLHEAERRMHCANVQQGCYQVVLEQMRLRLLVRQKRWQPALSLALAIEERLGTHASCLPPLHTPSLPQRNRLLLALAEQGCGRTIEARERLHALFACCEQLQFAVLANETEHALAGMDDALEGASHVSPDNEDGLLTSRERAVLQLLAQGLTNKEIGTCLFISVNTVKVHTKKINVKLGVSRRAQAVMEAKARGILNG